MEAPLKRPTVSRSNPALLAVDQEKPTTREGTSRDWAIVAPVPTDHGAIRWQDQRVGCSSPLLTIWPLTQAALKLDRLLPYLRPPERFFAVGTQPRRADALVRQQLKEPAERDRAVPLLVEIVQAGASSSLLQPSSWLQKSPLNKLCRTSCVKRMAYARRLRGGLPSGRNWHRAQFPRQGFPRRPSGSLRNDPADSSEYGPKASSWEIRRPWHTCWKSTLEVTLPSRPRE